MGKSKIEWTEETWNPVTGCVEVSPGCDHCYAKTFAERWRGTPGHPYENGFDLTLRPERLDQPMRWTKPRRVFVNSMSDLFHDDVPDEFIAEVFARMWWSPQHTFQVLTKRHGRMRSLVPRIEADLRKRSADLALVDCPTPLTWPLPNVWLGASVETQQWADIRIPALLDTPAAVRWLSCEPLLGPVNIAPWLPRGFERQQGGYWLHTKDTDLHGNGKKWIPGQAIGWVVVGGESGPGARPMHPDWARDLRDQCAHAEVPFFFKQWGEWVPEFRWVHGDSAPAAFLDAAGAFRPLVNGKPEQPPMARGEAITIRRAGKKRAGRVLDGRTHDEYPAVASA